MRYSGFRVIAEALTGHKGWKPVWRDPAPQAEYDYIIVNHDIDSSVESVRAILRAERLRRQRQIGLTDFVKGLREGQ